MRGPAAVAKALRTHFGEIDAAIVDGRLSWAHAEVIVRHSNRRNIAALASVQAELIADAQGRVFEHWARYTLGVARALDEAGGHDPGADIAANRLHLHWSTDSVASNGEPTGGHVLDAHAAIERVTEELHRRFTRDHALDESIAIPEPATL